MSTLATLQALVTGITRGHSAYRDVAIADAFAYCRSLPFRFNGGLWKFSTASDVSEYELPQDFIGIRGDVYCIPSGQSDDERYVLESMPYADLQRERFEWADYQRYVVEESGFPAAYAVNPTGNKIVIAPKPGDGGDVIYFEYTRDLGTPTYTASVSASPNVTVTATLTGPDGETLPATFTNEWLKTGFNLILWRAVYILLANYHGGTESATANANAAAARFSQEQQRLQAEMSQSMSVNRRARDI